MKSIFKVIGQILIILFFAGLVIGALYLAVQSNAIPLPARGESRFSADRFEGQPPATADGEFRPRFGDDGAFERGERGGDISILRSMGGLMGSLLKITLITAIVLLIQNFARYKRPPQPVAAPSNGR